MSQILNKLRDVDPNNSEAIKEALSPFLQQLSKNTETNCGLWLNALENAINRFPKYCMSQRGNIETYLAHFLDCSNYYIVIEAAKCAHALQQVRPTQEKTATAKSCWRDQMNDLCNAAHALLGAIFPNTVDIYQQMGKTEREKQPPSSPFATALSNLSSITINTHSNKVLNKQNVLNTRLRNVFVFIQAMLVEIYPVGKPIRPQTILDVIVRALSVTSGNNANQNLANVVVVKTQSLRTLDALVACLGPNLIPFSPLVFRFVMQTLKWCSDNPSEQSRVVRCAAYSSLSSWLTTLHTARGAGERTRGWEDELADHILADITPTKHIVELKMSSQPTKNLSKKAKRKLANSMLMESNMSSHMPGGKNKVAVSDESNEAVAIAALECAEIFFIVCGIFLKPTTYKRFQERLVRSCYSLHSHSPTLALPLLRALDAARKAAHRDARAHSHLAMDVYAAQLNNRDREISNFCAQALLEIRLHLHCGPPSLNFAVELPPDAQNKEEKKKQISEKNRRALEELLADKASSQTSKEEVITIADEPSNKRRKLDEDDRISVSSASSSSIEISDDTEDGVVQEVQVVIETVDNDDHDEDIIDIVPVRDEAENVDQNNTETDATKTIDITQEDDIHNQATQLPNKDTEDISEDKVDSTQTENDNVSNYEASSKLPSTATIYEAETQLPPNTSIYDASTQLPLNISNDDEDETSLSMEVAYDYPNTGKEKVPVLEKLDGDNLPSTNETDDIQITCGQDVKHSQEIIDIDAKKSDGDVVKVNGINGTVKKPVQISDVTEGSETVTVAGKDLNVEEMLADFVDEVNEDPTQPTQA